MPLTQLLLYLAAGRLWTWLLQTNGLTRDMWQLHPKLSELSECDLCLGFWVFLGLGAFLPRPFGIWPGWIEKPLFAGVSAFFVHLMKLGWVQKFGVIYD